MKRKNITGAVLFAVIIVFVLNMSAMANGEIIANDTSRNAILREKLLNTTQEELNETIEKFPDIKLHWSRDCVAKLALLDIVSGYANGNFGPENVLRFDEFLKMTLRSMGYKVEEGSRYWAEPYINLAKELKLIDEKESIDYKKEILREEAAKIIVKAALKEEEAPIPNHTSYAKLRIPDYYTIGDEYKQEVLYAYSMGLITGIGDRSFMPKETLTRGEGSTIVMRYLDKSLRKPLRPDESETVMIYTTYKNLEYEIYPPLKPEVIEVIKSLKESMSKSKGFSRIGYNPTEELIFFDYYENKEAYEQSTIFNDCSISIRMAEWELSGYDVDIFDAIATKELHREVIVDLINSLLKDKAETVIKDFDYMIELAMKKQGIPYQKEYKLNGRRVIISKHNSDNSFGLAICLKEE